VQLISTQAETSWRRGRFDRRAGPRKLLFGAMYEDAAIELGAFRVGGRIFSIASAGCTAMKLAAEHEVVAVDINPIQLAYAAGRSNGAPPQRGAAERMLAFLRHLGPLTGWSRARVRSFLDLDDPAEQIAYWRRHLDTRRFRAAFSVLFSAAALRSHYSASFLDWLPSNFGNIMRTRMERCFARHANRSNAAARALLLGEIPTEPPIFNPRRIRFAQADAAGFLEQQPAGSFDGFTLSNILDGASESYGKRLLAAVKHAAAPGALAILRSFREPPAPHPENRACEDRSMLWGIVDVRRAAGS